MRKVERQADGTQKVLEFTGPPTGKGSENPANWREVMVIPADSVPAFLVRVAADVELAPIEGGVLVVIGNVRHGIPREQAEALRDGLVELLRE